MVVLAAGQPALAFANKSCQGSLGVSYYNFSHLQLDLSNAPNARGTCMEFIPISLMHDDLAAGEEISSDDT